MVEVPAGTHLPPARKLHAWWLGLVLAEAHRQMAAGPIWNTELAKRLGFPPQGLRAVLGADPCIIVSVVYHKPRRRYVPQYRLAAAPVA